MKAPDDTPINAAEHLLRTAIHTIGARRATYGPPKEHFARTVAAINAIFAHKLREPLTESDWAMVMILDKLARHHGPSKSADTPVDLAGYAACLAECEQGLATRPRPFSDCPPPPPLPRLKRCDDKLARRGGSAAELGRVDVRPFRDP